MLIPPQLKESFWLTRNALLKVWHQIETDLEQLNELKKEFPYSSVYHLYNEVVGLYYEVHIQTLNVDIYSEVLENISNNEWEKSRMDLQVQSTNAINKALIKRGNALSQKVNTLLTFIEQPVMV